MVIDDRIKAWIARFWFLRGVLAALVILAPISSALEMSRYEFLRFTYSIFVGWDHTATMIGRLIGSIIFVPNLTSVQVNALIFLLTLCVPGAIGFRSWWTKDRLSKQYFKKSYHRSFFEFAFRWMIPVYFVIFFPFLYLMLNYPSPPGTEVGVFLYGMIQICALLAAVAYLPGYAKGVFLFITFLMTFQVLYFLPIVGDVLNGFSDVVLGPAETASP